jgi:hypothetical protein
VAQREGGAAPETIALFRARDGDESFGVHVAVVREGCHNVRAGSGWKRAGSD